MHRITKNEIITSALTGKIHNLSIAKQYNLLVQPDSVTSSNKYIREMLSELNDESSKKLLFLIQLSGKIILDASGYLGNLLEYKVCK